MSVIIVTTPEELGKIVEAAVQRALAKHDAKKPRPNDRLTLQEAARELRCSPRTVRSLISELRLRPVKLSKGGSSRVLVPRSEIERLLAESTA